MAAKKKKAEQNQAEEQPQDQSSEEQPQDQSSEEQPQTDQETFDQEQSQPQTDQEQTPTESSDPDPEQAPSEDESANEPYQPKRTPLQNAGLDQHAAEEKRQADLDEERQVHNKRTGGSEVRASWGKTEKTE